MPPTCPRPRPCLRRLPPSWRSTAGSARRRGSASMQRRRNCRTRPTRSRRASPAAFFPLPRRSPSKFDAFAIRHDRLRRRLSIHPGSASTEPLISRRRRPAVALRVDRPRLAVFQRPAAICRFLSRQRRIVHRPPQRLRQSRKLVRDIAVRRRRRRLRRQHPIRLHRPGLRLRRTLRSVRRAATTPTPRRPASPGR